MKMIGLLLALAIGGSASAQTFENSIHAVEKDQVKTDILVYKVKNQMFELQAQSWRPFLSRLTFKTHGLFRQMARVTATAELGRYYVRKYPKALSKTEAVNELRVLQFDRNVELAYFEPKISDAVMLNRKQKPFGQQQQPPPRRSRFHPRNKSRHQFCKTTKASSSILMMRLSVSVRDTLGVFLAGTGKGIRLIDVETGWDTGHFEFGTPFYTNGNNAHVAHGTAVWGEIAARRDDIGVTGIAYEVDYGIAGNSFFGNWADYPMTIAGVIEGAVAAMQAGDVLVIEQHAPLIDDYGPIEYFEPVFKILKAATDAGIHCVAAAGNGYSDLDDPKFNGAFDLNLRDSGCILVGASLSPRGMKVHERIEFSNYGSRVDAFGYGEDVVTTGYGDLFSGSYLGKNATFTSSFSGTSSATPIVTGAVVGLLGIAKAKGVNITPKQLREALRLTGTEQKGANRETQRIGNLPDIKQLIEYFQLN